MKSTGKKILIAEDNKAIHALYDKVFKSEGYEVVIVEAGGQVMAELEESQYDLLITDLKLEGMSALEFLPEIRKKNSDLPILVVSGHYGQLIDDFHQKGFNVDLFLNKPVSLVALKTAARCLLGLPDESEKNSAKKTFSFQKLKDEMLAKI
jgi:DNA-binding response OmpR family regulator